jgi:hypothetical protein
VVSLIIVVVCILFGLATYAVLYQLGLLPGSPGQTEVLERPGELRPRRFDPQTRQELGVSLVRREYPQGCLTTLIVAATLWFVLWGVVLVLALRVLSSPYG